MFSEFEKYLADEHLATGTIKAHIRNMERFDIPNMTLEDLEEHTLAKQLDLCATLSRWYRFNGKDHSIWAKKTTEINATRKPKPLTSTLTMADLKKKREDYYLDKNYRHYLVMYLLIQFQVRNKDLNLQIVPHTIELENDKNYLVVFKSHVEYIRMDYKTVKNYGVKSNRIINPKVMKACKEIMGGHLLTYKNLSLEVIRICGIGEAELLKIFLKEHNHSLAFKTVSKNRGTGLDNLLTAYADTS